MDEKEAEARPLMGTIFLVIDMRRYISRGMWSSHMMMGAYSATMEVCGGTSHTMEVWYYQS